MGSITVAGLVMIFASLWLLVFLIVDLKEIVEKSRKLNEELSIKNLFVIFVMGYVILETATIKPQILN